MIPHPAIMTLKEKLLRTFPNRLRRFIVFGSYVRGDRTSDSDIDILVSLSGEVDWPLEKRISRLTLETELEYDVILDVKVFSEDRLKSTIVGSTPFMQTVMKEGVPI